MKDVKVLLNKEEQARIAIEEAKNVLANVETEKQELGIKKVAELQEILEALGCSYLLESNIAEAVTKISINKGRIVEVVKDREVKVEVKVEDTTKIDALTKELEAAKNKEKEYIATIKEYVAAEKTAKETLNNELEQQISQLKRVNAAMDAKIIELTNEKELVEQHNTEAYEIIEQLKAKISELESKTAVNTTVYDEYAEYNEYLNSQEYDEILKAEELAFLASQEEDNAYHQVEEENNDKDIKKTVENVLANRKNNGKRGGSPKERLIEEFNNISNEDIKDLTMEIPVAENKQEQQPEVKAPKFVQEVCGKVGGNSNAKLYQTESCFVIASSTTKEMTWLSNNPISDEYKDAVEQMLVAENKILPNRMELSPVIVQTADGYMARAKAVKGLDAFDREDVLVGYVKIDGKFYLYSYSAQYRSPGKKNIKSLDAILNNDPIVNPDEATCSKVTSRVWSMNKKYQELVKEEIAKRADKAKAATEARNEKKNKRNSRFKANTELVLASGISIEKKESKLKGLNVSANNSSNTAFAGMVDDFAASIF